MFSKERMWLMLMSLMFTIACNVDGLTMAAIQIAKTDYVEREIPVKYVSSNEVLGRAFQMASMEWTPVGQVPTNGGAFFEPGVKVKGVPYSSVKEINTYLFQDVSYHTFMTAVHNPHSVLYTENISLPPYHGANCATYYGSVCSSSIMWTFGINIPYYANQIKDLSFVKKNESQLLDSLKVCDIMWRPGHVQMIYNLEYKADTLYSITTFESAGKVAHITSYTKERFKQIWAQGGYVGYRYQYLDYSKDSLETHPFDPVEYNDDLCPSKGDKSVYRYGDLVSININSQFYDTIELMKNGTVISREAITGNIYHYDNLEPGIYFVSLIKGSKSSALVSFEVVNASISVTRNDRQNTLKVCFHSEDIPEYVALCTITGDSRYFPITEDDINQGYIVVPQLVCDEYYCKVVFRGKYGSIINTPVRVF